MKIHIVGASGSGVTTLGKALEEKLDITYFDSDDYFWLPSNPPFIQRRNPADRNQLILEDLHKTQSWILGGSVIDWGENVFPAFDLVVFLYVPKEIRLERLINREKERYCDIIEKDPIRRKRFSDFIVWAKDYDNNSGIADRTLKAHQAWLAKIRAPVLELNRDLSVKERVEHIIDQLSKEKLLPK